MFWPNVSSGFFCTVRIKKKHNLEFETHRHRISVHYYKMPQKLQLRSKNDKDRKQRVTE